MHPSCGSSQIAPSEVLNALFHSGDSDAAQIWPFLLAGAVLVLSVARGLDALALGEDVARGLGQKVATALSAARALSRARRRTADGH